MFGFFKSKRSAQQQGPSTPQQTPSASDTPPRDYLREATSMLRAPKPIGDLLLEDRAGVLNNLIGALLTHRKVAAYALGQIGDPRTLPVLQECLANCPIKGDREALVAAITAINVASESTEMERRKIIEAVYNGKMRPQLQKW